MTWFQQLTGFDESTPEAVREKLQVDGKLLTSVSSQNVYRCGVLEIPSLADLRKRVDHVDVLAGRIKVREVVADVQKLHADEANAGALFQVASQFNLLEIVSLGVKDTQRIRR